MERDGRNDLRLETNPNGDIVSRKLQETEKKKHTKKREGGHWIMHLLKMFLKLVVSHKNEHNSAFAI